MVNTKKSIILISVIFVAIMLICFVLHIFQSPIERQFSTIIKEYDKTYSTRIKSKETNETPRVYNLPDNEKGFLTTSVGYEDVLLIFVILDDTKVTKVEVLYHNETKDYGDYVTEDWFLERLLLPYDNKLQVVRRNKTNSNEVIAITGATITSTAVVQAVNNCIDIMEEIDNEN